MKYQILASETQGELEEMVNHAIAEGWTPLGGISTAGVDRFVASEGYNETHWEYNQAMIREQ